MNVFLSVAILSVTLTVVAGQCNWGAPYGGCTTEHASKKDMRSGERQELFQDPVDREIAEDSVTTRNKMESELKNKKSPPKYRYEDIRAYLKDLYQ
ncbi:uncharacterized protein LOC144657708 [Oculina patagonica]